ncbi:hypothetical protein OESDEN_13739 [Oesophagostomum dentatum]|uniref:Uncharacterized protein n=1 Tax=Oesophagostomum dentatum TaxID=61180 RepID=A0A0B1SRI5_OESDE|nr:hypothetical protein OESDEN_13739 [Oesophagostomum dentatum]
MTALWKQRLYRTLSNAQMRNLAVPTWAKISSEFPPAVLTLGQTECTRRSLLGGKSFAQALAVLALTKLRSVKFMLALK